MQNNLDKNAFVEGANSHHSGYTCRDNSSTLSIIYFNTRSLVPKFDELCLVVESHSPYVVSIVESWLCDDIPDSEIHIPGYQLLCNDRNRHGGGVLMYINNSFTVEELPSFHLSTLEILPVVVRYLNFKCCITAFYRPPSSPVSIFDTLTSFLASLSISQVSHFVLLGDFNVNIRNPSHTRPT